MATKKRARSTCQSLDTILDQIQQASDYSRSAVGSATQFVKTVQQHLREKIGDNVTDWIRISEYTDEQGFTFFCDLEWDGKRLLLAKGMEGDTPDEVTRKPALELPGLERIEVAKYLPELIADILNLAKEQAVSLGKLADQSRSTASPLDEGEEA